MSRDGIDRRANDRRRSMILIVSLGLITSSILGCSAGSLPPTDLPSADREMFEDATDRLGVRFTHDCGNPADYSMVRLMGSGCAIFDANGDGRPDILLLQNAGPSSTAKNQLYLQGEDGRFANASDGSGLDIAGHNMGVAIGDIDGDDRPDVLLTQYLGARLFRNLGGGKFLDVTATSGIANPFWGTSASFVDYDRDGRLDVVILNYLAYDPKVECQDTAGKRDFCGPTHFPKVGPPAQLFRNLGPGPDGAIRFSNTTMSSGIGRVSGPGLGVYCADLTGDGWPDIFVANDGRANYLWVNQTDGTFREEAVARGLAFTGDGKTAANMGVAVGDVDGDGLNDLFVTHLTTEMNTLWKQGPAGRFTDRTLAAAAVATRWRGTGFGTVIADFDADGWPDLALVNGRVIRGQDMAANLPDFWKPYGERNQLLRNVAGKFVDVSSANPAFCAVPNVARGLAVGDLNGDGFPDLVVNSIGGPAKVYLNRPTAAHWLAVVPRLSDGRLAHGAEVRLHAGGRVRLRVLQPSESYLSSNNPEIVFGLNDLARYEEIEVRWPDGSRSTHPAGEANRRMVIHQPRR